MTEFWCHGALCIHGIHGFIYCHGRSSRVVLWLRSNEHVVSCSCCLAVDALPLRAQSWLQEHPFSWVLPAFKSVLRFAKDSVQLYNLEGFFDYPQFPKEKLEFRLLVLVQPSFQIQGRAEQDQSPDPLAMGLSKVPKGLGEGADPLQGVACLWVVTSSDCILSAEVLHGHRIRQLSAENKEDKTPLQQKFIRWRWSEWGVSLEAPGREGPPATQGEAGRLCHQTQAAEPEVQAGSVGKGGPEARRKGSHPPPHSPGTEKALPRKTALPCTKVSSEPGTWPGNWGCVTEYLLGFSAHTGWWLDTRGSQLLGFQAWIRGLGHILFPPLKPAGHVPPLWCLFLRQWCGLKRICTHSSPTPPPPPRLKVLGDDVTKHAAHL